MTPHSRTQEVLFESEAALRLVDHEIDELRGLSHADHRLAAVHLSELPDIVARANQQILDVLTRLRETRSALQSPTFDKFRVTYDKLREVTSATEDAAINIMDACDRASGLVDELDAIDQHQVPDRTQAAVLRAALRDELFRMMGALQFQDITSQQLNHASASLVEMESRLADVASLFDANISASTSAAMDGVDLPYDPDATLKNAEGRQALADEIFTSIKPTAD